MNSTKIIGRINFTVTMA